MKQLTADNVEEEILQHHCVIVAFAATACPPCDIVKAVLYRLIEEEKLFECPLCIAYMPNSKEDYEAAVEKFCVSSFPTVRIYKLGNVIAEKRGAFGTSEIATLNAYRKWLQSQLPTEPKTTGVAVT